MHKPKDEKEKTDAEILIEDTKSELFSYVEKTLSSLKLSAYEKSAILGSYITYGLIILLMFFCIFFLLLLALGYLLGEVLDSNAAGFGILILLSVFSLILFVVNGKKFRRYITNLVILLIKKIESNEE